MARVDVLIVTALQEELDAARAVGLTHAVSTTNWVKQAPAGITPFETIKIENVNGDMLSIALVRPTRMGGRVTSPLATALTQLLKPQCLAMPGVCAGNPGVAALGDVVVAEMVYEFDEGKWTATDFLGDHRQFLMEDRWVREAQEFSPAGLPSHGKATSEEAKYWFLERLLAGDDPREYPARARYFPGRSWQSSLDEFESQGLIVRSDPGWTLTDQGTSSIKRKLYDDVDGPDYLPFEVVTAPIASGSSVVKDGITWDKLARMGVRTVAALEMEAATIATVAHQLQVPHWLIAKGVMDHADPRKNDRYKSFAARASAEVLFALLRRLLVPVGPTRPQVNDLAPKPSQAHPIGQPSAPWSPSDIARVTEEHQRTLQQISDMFRQNDSWPAFNLIDRPLRRLSVDAELAIMSMPNQTAPAPNPTRAERTGLG